MQWHHARASRTWGVLFILASLCVYIVWLKKLFPVKLISKEGFYLNAPYIGLQQRRTAIPSISRSKLEELQVDRKQVIFDCCKGLPAAANRTVEAPQMDSKAKFGQIIVDDEHKLLYCYVPKVACTNWKRVLMVLMGKANTTEPLLIDSIEPHKPDVFRRLDSYTKEEIRYRLDHYLKFVFVRNPFERLLSAYRDKLNPGNKYFQTEFGRKIVRTYRLNASQESLLLGHDVTFREFIQYLINFHSSDEKAVFNEHWRPVFDMCLPCVVRYDIVGKYETINDDAWLVLEKAGLGRRIQFPHVGNSTTSSLLHTFMSQLTHQEVEMLYQIYENDFNFFGFDRAV